MTNRSQNWVVLKFGGTSVSSVENWENIATIINSRLSEGRRVCLVHSALSGISNLLEGPVEKTGELPVDEVVKKIKERHRRLAGEMNLNADELLEKEFEALGRLSETILSSDRLDYAVYAEWMALGELMSTKIGHAFLTHRGIDVVWRDARDMLESIPATNASEKSLVLSAICDTAEDETLQNELGQGPGVLLTQGFIASDSRGRTVLLGRGGSDVSAAYFAARLQADRLEIWTDVPGMFSANPHDIPSARLLKQLSYEEAQEIATNGAKVLHPRCIRPVRLHGIPIHIKWTANPELEGTVISASAGKDEALVKAISVRTNVKLVSMETLGMWQQVGFLADAFEVFKHYGLSIDLVSTSESNVTVSLDPGANTHFHEIRESFVNDLGAYCKVRVIDSTAAVSLLGRHIRAILHQLGSAFEVFQEHEVYLVSQAANDLNFTFVVEAEQAGRLVRQLHDQVISQSADEASFGPTWQQIIGQETGEVRFKDAWWRERREELIGIAEAEGPSYVYDLDTVREHIRNLKAVKPVDRLFYAMKANANRDILEVVHEEGLGFECVSIGEMEYVGELFPGMDADRILFTPNFAPRSEYEAALEREAHVTLDNSYILQKWPELFRGRSVLLRIDPGHGHGHHKYVRTGGVHSKFGIPRFELDEVQQLAGEYDIHVEGLHAHQGSGIKDPGSWRETARILARVAQRFDGVKILNVGGGLGIRENEMQSVLELDKVAESLAEFRGEFPDFELWMEPGRYLVAAAGVLLARVTQIKGKGDIQYVGVETGMNSLIRPALYGSHHTIVNLSRLEDPATRLATIVGPICESADKLGIDRLFPDSEEGDVILVANTGAYGRVMSSSYNLRMPAREMVI